MPEKHFMVYLNGAEDPMDLAYRQSVRASRVEVSQDGLSFSMLTARSRPFSTSQLFTVGVR
jgi:hypothetical protein